MKVFVGLSGGVDSATSAALLKAQGHDVVGVFIKIWSPEFLECTWREDRLDAMRVAVHLQIPFMEIDLSKQYLDEVIQDMIANYRKGRTPNPDVLCNSIIKFGAFKKWALENGAEKIATGHYARVQKHADEYSLFRGIDANKDQSYFLYRLTQDDLAVTLFPAGELSKPEVRVKASMYGLPVAEKPDSQGLCFVGDISMHEFLGRFIKLSKGELLDEAGTSVGEHDGAALYTVGQRHGFSLAPDAPPGPYYVTGIDAKKNIVHVSKTIADTRVASCNLVDTTWIGDAPQGAVEAVARYRAKATRATIEGARITFEEPQQATPGQSMVLYDGERCLGGGIIA